MDVEFIKAFADLGKQIESQVGGLAAAIQRQFAITDGKIDKIDSKLEGVIKKNYLLRDGDNTEYKV